MPLPALFGISVAFSFVVWAIVVRQYVWPVLSRRNRVEAVRPILLLHGFRFVGLAFLIPGVVSPDLPAEFARPVAYGDLATAILALLAFGALGSRLGTSLVWAFNLVGTADLLYAFYQGNHVSIAAAPGLQGAAFFLPTLVVPLLLITHVVVFRLLLGRDMSVAARGKPQAA